MIKTFVLGSAPPSNADLPLTLGDDANGTTVEVSVSILTDKSNRFTLADATGASSAAFASKTLQTNLTSHINPAIQYWLPLLSDGVQAVLDMLMDDEGNSENTGVVALLQRGARRIALFANTMDPLDMSADRCDATYYGKGSSVLLGKVTAQLVGLFQGYASVSGIIYTNNGTAFPHDDLQPLVCAGQTLVHDGKPFVAKGTNPVLPNAR